MAEKYKLIYFNLRGIHGEAIRYIFAYAGVEYEDHRIEREDWPAQKQKFQWGQLPALQVGDKTLYQSNAIMRYLGRKFGLCGDGEWESSKIDEYADVLDELQAAWRVPWIEKDETKKAELTKKFREETVPKYFEKFENILKRNPDSPYVFGKKITWFDIRLAHFLDYFDGQETGLLGNYPRLKSLRDHFLKLPKIKAWIDKRPVTDL